MILECLMVSTIYGINPIMYKHAVGFISVESFIIIFGLFYFAITLIFMYYFRHKLVKDIDVLRGNSHVYGVIFVSALLLFIFGDYVYVSLLENNKSYIVTSIVAAYPLVTILFGWLLFNEEIKAEHFAGVLSIILGVVLVTR